MKNEEKIDGGTSLTEGASVSGVVPAAVASHAEPAFTPGPWQLDPFKAVRANCSPMTALVHNGRYEIARVIDCNRNPENEANAHLIAAAPEMYEALKKAKQTIRDWHGEIAWDHYQASPEMRAINTAIAKAEGHR